MPANLPPLPPRSPRRGLDLSTVLVLVAFAAILVGVIVYVVAGTR